MKKKELKKRIEEGFEELAPDMSDAIIKAAEEQEIVTFREESGEQAIWTKKETLEHKNRQLFGFVKGFEQRFPKYALSICAVIVLFFFCIFGSIGENRKTAYIIVDINPSIRLELDDTYRVKNVRGLNQDGKDVVKTLTCEKEKPVDELMDILIETVVEKSYLKDNDGILLTFFAEDENIYENLEEAVENRIVRKLAELHISGITVAAQRAETLSDLEGRRILEDELIKTSGLTKEEVQKMSVKELINRCQGSLDLKISEQSKEERTHSLLPEAGNDEIEATPAQSMQKDAEEELEKRETEQNTNASSINETPALLDTKPDIRQEKRTEHPSQEATESPTPAEGNSGEEEADLALPETAAPPSQESYEEQVPPVIPTQEEKKEKKKKEKKEKKKKEEKEKKKKEKKEKKKKEEKEEKQQNKKKEEKRKEEKKKEEKLDKNSAEKNEENDAEKQSNETLDK